MRNVFTKKVNLFIITLILTVIAQSLSVPLIFGTSISIAPIIYLASIRIFGIRFSLLLVVSFSFVTYFLHISNTLIFLSIVEVLLIGGLYTKKGKDIFTWSFAYSLVIFLIYFLTLLFFIDSAVLANSITNFLVLQLIIALMFSALIADILCDYAPFIPKFKGWFQKRLRLHFGQIISHILIFSAVFPLLIVILVTSRGLENNMYQEFQNQYDQLEDRLQIKINEMDSAEIQNYELDSELEKAKIKSRLDNYIGFSDKRVYILDQNNDVWLDTKNQSIEDRNLHHIETGYVRDTPYAGYIWLSNNQQTLIDWYQGYYIGETSFLNKRTFLTIPMDNFVEEIILELIDYLIFVLAVVGVSLFFGIIVNRILSKSFIQLTQITSDLPEKMERQESFHWKETNIEEFSRLRENIKKVANQLQSMFVDAKKRNELLTARTNQLIDSEAKLYRLAHYDTLTELPNRYSFHIDLKEILNEKSLKERFAIVFIDLDKFKQVNDTLGHSGGDLLLKVFSKRLIQFEKDYPVCFYRLAGDEFVAIVTLAEEKDVQLLIDHMMEVVNQPLVINRKEMTLTASIGISFYPDNGKTIDDLLHYADSRMYEQKRVRHNQHD
ncbi:diguanylate cyclase domain-containing protein [Gracilibacillus kekensis]|uniref:Diguanylate cyclase (GGDEF) domain-containing protein n=1 Tax=Gracilibacillus kekensis TaxID=1027249 RepID=A0A1M7QVW4_9BACI|nr:diguanylate cyclase [Gracilibacillus kekensis]SHN36025.1 diguanylate cyclase (GGDEF) domain-containing protein [Gracilibacillus kekensis]